MENEPISIVATITAAATAVLGLLVSFAVQITDAQQSAILAVTAVVAPLIVIISRKWTAPWAKVVALADPDAVRIRGEVAATAGPASVLQTGDPVVVEPRIAT